MKGRVFALLLLTLQKWVDYKQTCIYIEIRNEALMSNLRPVTNPMDISQILKHRHTYRLTHQDSYELGRST